MILFCSPFESDINQRSCRGRKLAFKFVFFLVTIKKRILLNNLEKKKKKKNAPENHVWFLFYEEFDFK